MLLLKQRGQCWLWNQQSKKNGVKRVTAILSQFQDTNYMIFPSQNYSELPDDSLQCDKQQRTESGPPRFPLQEPHSRSRAGSDKDPGTKSTTGQIRVCCLVPGSSLQLGGLGASKPTPRAIHVHLGPHRITHGLLRRPNTTRYCTAAGHPCLQPGGIWTKRVLSDRSEPSSRIPDTSRTVRRT